MEVMISAAILIVVVLGVLASLDGVTRAAGGNKARTIAATLAEQDQERLRSLPTSDLNKLSVIETATRPVVVAGVTYTIESKAEWVVDATGVTLSCVVAPGDGSYLRIKSTVTSPMTGARVRPVVLSSIVAPRPGKGTLTAMVKNAAGGPVVGAGVQAIGPTPDTKTTNASGCAVFDESDAGSYTLRLNTTNWVDPNGVQSPVKTTTVSAGNLSTVEFVYDNSSSFNVSTYTVVGGVEQPDRSNGVIAAHTGLTLGNRTVTSAPGATTFAFTLMFPFTSPYLVYSGGCDGNNPSNAIPSYYSTHPNSVVQLTPGGATVAAKALEPAILLSLTSNGGVLSSDSFATVYAYPKTPGCATTRISMGTTSSAGALTEPGLPFGLYDICVQYRDTSPSPDRFYAHTFTNVNNVTPAGTSLTRNFTGSSTTPSTCP